MARDYSFRHAPSSRSSTPRQATPVVVPSRPHQSTSNSKFVSSFDMVTSMDKTMSAITPIKKPTAAHMPPSVSVPITNRSMEFVQSQHSQPAVKLHHPVVNAPQPKRVVEVTQTPLTTPHDTTQDAQPRDDRKRTTKILPLHFSRPKLITTLCYSLAAFAIVAGGVLTVKTMETNAESKVQVAQLRQDAEAVTGGQSASADAQASATKSSSTAPYSVAPDLPKYISIPKLGMRNVKIVQVGLTKDGAVGAPLTATSTAWYTGSAKPGDAKGAMFIDGHVMGEADGRAVLTALKTLAAGDTITIIRGDDRTFTFEVVKKATVALDAVDMAEMLRSADATKLGLNLMTCGGTYDKKTQTFDHRTEVFAVLRK